MDSEANAEATKGEGATKGEMLMLPTAAEAEKIRWKDRWKALGEGERVGYKEREARERRAYERDIEEYVRAPSLDHTGVYIMYIL